MDHARVLPSVYRGIAFRSRTEARWAIYFDALGLAWEYETEAYALPSGNYLPDFLLPPRGGRPARWVEIKGAPALEVDHRLARELAALTGLEVFIFAGPPVTSRAEGQSWGPNGGHAEPVCLSEDPVASERAATASANARWDKGGEAIVPGPREEACSTPAAATGGESVPTLPLDVRLRASDRRFEHERLVAGALFLPEFFSRVRDDLPAEEIADPGLASVWRAMLAIDAAGETLTVEAVAHRLAYDTVGSCALAALPDDLPFKAWIPDALSVRAQCRAKAARMAAVLQVFAPHKSGGVA